MAWKNVQYDNGKYRTSEGGGGGGSSTFADLEDVNFSDLQNGQVPKYNSDTGKWENANESGGGGTVTDVLVNGTSVIDANNKAQIKSYKEVTQAEYNALPASKTSDDILYCIKDSAGADGFPPLIYSDEEREVGVWRDGKPLYQKTINIPISSITGNETTINHNIANVDTIYFADGCMVRAGNLTLPLVTYHTVSSWAASIFNLTRTSFVLYLGNDELSRVLNVYVTLQYTKTTDTAGSGIWTTQGGYAHHYSADEHIIGTWFGKTLWEKTIYYSSPGGTADTNKIIDTSIKHGVNCNIVDVQGVQTYGYLNGNMPNDTSDPEPIAQSNLYLPYYAPSTSTNISPAHIYFYSDGVHFMKRCPASEANGIILTVRYIKK